VGSVSSKIYSTKSRNNEDGGEVHLKWESEYEVMGFVRENEIQSVFLIWYTYVLFYFDLWFRGLNPGTCVN
jgi:hypothetical protein